MSSFSWCSWLSHQSNTLKVSSSNLDENNVITNSNKRILLKFGITFAENNSNCNFLTLDLVY